MHVSIIEPPSQGVASHSGAEFFCKHLERLEPEAFRMNGRILVAGCGAGHEAALIQTILGTEVHAVDVEDFLDESFRNWQDLHYHVASVCELPYDNSCFDAIFYHHVIEHVDNPACSLAELSRVLKPNGWIFIGTPNRHRLISSVGAHRQSTWEPNWRNKLKDNVDVYAARLKGSFRNELGAHAGFTQRELSGLLESDFSDQRWVTPDYLRYKYRDHRLSRLVPMIVAPPWRNIAAPSIYVFARNGK